MINDYEATRAITTDAVPVESSSDSNEIVISTLNNLIETCRDGELGFKEAAEGVEHSDLKTLFSAFSQQWNEYSAVLQELVLSLGGTPATGGTLAGAVHRGWIYVKSAVTGNDDQSILNECERGEDFAKEAYNEALQASLPANIADIVAQQSHAIIATHNRIKELRDAESHKVKSAAPGI